MKAFPRPIRILPYVSIPTCFQPQKHTHTHTLTRPGFGELCRSNIKCYTSANVMTAINVSACGWGVGVWVVALPSISVSLACFYRSGRAVRCRMLPPLLCARTCAGRKFVTGQRKFPSSRVACMLARLLGGRRGKSIFLPLPAGTSLRFQSSSIPGVKV